MKLVWFSEPANLPACTKLSVQTRSVQRLAPGRSTTRSDASCASLSTPYPVVVNIACSPSDMNGSSSVPLMWAVPSHSIRDGSSVRASPGIADDPTLVVWLNSASMDRLSGCISGTSDAPPPYEPWYRMAIAWRSSYAYCRMSARTGYGW